MIIKLDEAKEIDVKVTQDDLDAFEVAVRRLTNSNFQNKRVRFKNLEIVEPSTIKVKSEIRGLRIGDTVEINYSDFNNGLYVVKELTEKEIIVNEESFYTEKNSGLMLTKVEYPADIKRGIKKLIEYDKKMAGKVGIKSETVARMSITYYDVNSTENTDGYPSSLLSFLRKYEKMRW